MKKIMFNDRYGLTEAVLTGRKTMTRRIMPDNTPLGNWEETVSKSRYQVGEEIAVAQSYRDIYNTMEEKEGNSKANEWWCRLYDYIGDGLGPAVTSGYRNKMFVCADFMPHRIRITDIKAERLQDISDEDCLKEGIFESGLDRDIPGYGKTAFEFKCPSGHRTIYPTPRKAFAALIDRISGKGTWERNPYVFAYTFELMK